MATKLSAITVADHQRVVAEVKKVFEISVEEGFVLLKYSAPSSLQLQSSSPRGTIPQLLSLLDDAQVQYALVRLPPLPGDDKGPKDVFLTWVGCNVGKIERGKKSEHLADVKSVLGPSHIDLTALTRQNFTHKTLRELADPSSGTHVLKPSDAFTEQQTFKATLKADEESRKTHEEKLIRQGEQKQKQAPKVTSSSAGGPVVKLSAVTVANPDLVAAAVGALLDKLNRQGFVLLHYSGGPTHLSLQATGFGSAETLLPHLEDNQIQYALIRLPPSPVTKDVFLTWVGPKVSKIEQGKKSEHLADLKAVLGPAHSELTALTRVNFTEKKIRELADPSSGTHILKPPE